MPGRLDQQPPDMTIARLGQPTLTACGSRGVLRGDKTDIGADGASGEAVPITDLDGQAERGQGRDPPQTLQSIGNVGELRIRGHLSDRVIEPVTTIDCVQHCVEGSVECRLLAEVLETLLT